MLCRMTASVLRDVFEPAGCVGTVCVVALDDGREVGLDADEPVVAGSVFKVAVALEVWRRFAEGVLDPRGRVVLSTDERTPGPTGFSLFQDEVEVSWRDLVAAMLTISDNVATDALLELVGVDVVNESLAALGLNSTVITAPLRTLVDSIGKDAGFAGWADMQRWWALPHHDDELRRARARMLDARELRAATATRTTAREMATLLGLIWRDQAAPAQACAAVRELMGKQLTRHRIASGFVPPVRVWAKSGGLAGVVRNEVGVVRYTDGRDYAVAVFTRCETPRDEREINAAIGEVAFRAVNHLAGE